MDAFGVSVIARFHSICRHVIDSNFLCSEEHKEENSDSSDSDGKTVDAEERYVCASNTGAQLLLALGSPYLVSSLLPPPIFDLILKLISARYLAGNELDRLMRASPVMASAILSPEVLDASGKLKSELLQLLSDLLLLAAVPSATREDQREAFECITPDPDRSVDAEYWSSAKYWPHHPIIREQVCKHSADRYTKSESGTCKKCAPSKKKAMPGLLVLYCVHHNNVIGFEIMNYSESPRTLFRLFTTRWEYAPKFLFYDNGCNTHTFFHYREPLFFKDLQIILDGLHWSSHKKCSPVFNPTLHEHLKFLNSQLCEQLNSELSRLAPQMWIFNRTNFLFHLRSDMFFLNTKRRTNAYQN